MPAVSEKQQKFMGMVRSVQKGLTKRSDVSESVTEAADSMSPKDVKDFASTKHKDIPEKVDKEHKE